MAKKESRGIVKAPTGIAGFDELTGGGIPRGRTTLIAGGSGCGKSVFALQSLVHGARDLGEPGIFVAFEEHAGRIVANAATFGWELEALQRRRLFFLDAQPSPDLMHTEGATLEGLLAALSVRVRQMKAKRIVFDSLDILLPWLGDSAALQREVMRLHEWLHERDLTAIVTARTSLVNELPSDALTFIPFLVDCVVGLRHEEVDGVSQRNIRVLKYRGSGFSENTVPMMIGQHGIEVAAVSPRLLAPRASTERVSSGVRALDEMLGGGYFRGASILITGSPGTAKTTLAGAFLAAAGARGERGLFVSFDSAEPELVRNLGSVNLKLRPYLGRGLLHIEALSGTSASAERHFLYLRTLIERFNPSCLVIDPISALGKQGNEMTAFGVIERLTAIAKARGITTLFTSLLRVADYDSESSRLNISTIADTWIQLSYVVNAGERNRALTIVKSRGTAHSNQVRELVLGPRGVSLTDVYAAEGEVLMGSLRLQREQRDASEQARRSAERLDRFRVAESSMHELEQQVIALQREISARSAELELARASEQEADVQRAQISAARIAGRKGAAKR